MSNNKLLIFASKEEEEGYSLKNMPIAKKDSCKTVAEWALENKLDQPCQEKTQKEKIMNAHERYLDKRKQIDRDMKVLQRKLESMDIEENKDIKNWGFSGSCDRILEEIESLNDFLKGY